MADTDQPTLAVTQADREAAAALAGAIQKAFWEQNEQRVIINSPDNGLIAQAFARHHTHSEPRPTGDLREAFLTGFDVATKLLDDRIALGDPRWPEVRAFAADKFATHSPAPMAVEYALSPARDGASKT